MKAKYFLLGFLFLTLGAFCATANTRATDYSLDEAENSELILEVKTIDGEGIVDLFQPVDLEDGGNSWVENIGSWESGGPWFFADLFFVNIDEIGAKCKFRVDWINDSDDCVIWDEEKDENIEIDVWTVFYDVWVFVDPDNDFNPEPDLEEVSLVVFQDPDDLNKKTYIEDDINDTGANLYDLGECINEGDAFLIRGVATPVDDYLDEIDWQNDDWIPYVYKDFLDWDSELEEDDITWDWDVDENKVIHEASFVWDDTPEDSWGDGDTEIEEYIEETTFDENTGLMSLYQLMNDDEEIIYELAAVSAIPGYELPILLGITAVFIIGLVY
ncbi:MAG: hypothetical protein ACFFAN_10395, partial [Promethearchaeota archaeon]